MLGKRNTNCLSCGVESAGNKKEVKGRDGRYYRGETVASSLNPMTSITRDEIMSNSKKNSKLGSRGYSLNIHKRGHNPVKTSDFIFET
jgi:hypothetical protein